MHAANAGDFQGLVAVLAPEVVLHSDVGATGAPVEVHVAEAVARGARSFSIVGLLRPPALVNGVAGAVCTLDGKPFAVLAFTVSGGKIVEIDILRAPARLAELDLTVLDTWTGARARC